MSIPMNMHRNLVVLLATMALGGSAYAHHILGVPHYAYDEEYPQTPTLTYRVEAGPLELKMTGYPGTPQPGEACSLHVYIRRLDTGTPYDGEVKLTVFHDRLIGNDPTIYGPIVKPLEEAMYKFYPRFKEEGNYIVRIEYEAQGAPWTIDLPMVVGQPGSPWAVVAAVGAGLAAFLIVIRAVRIKQRRRIERTQNSEITKFADSVSARYPVKESAV